MKKAGLLFNVILVCTILLVLASCGSMSASMATMVESWLIVWDESVPPEQSSKVFFYMFIPTSYNGILMEKNKKSYYMFPAGTAEFTGDVEWWQQAGYNKYFFDYKDAVFSLAMEEEKTYTAWVGFKYSEDEKNKIWGVYLHEGIKVTNSTKDESYIGFIPFDPPVISN